MGTAADQRISAAAGIETAVQTATTINRDGRIRSGHDEWVRVEIDEYGRQQQARVLRPAAPAGRLWRNARQTRRYPPRHAGAENPGRCGARGSFRRSRLSDQLGAR